MPALLVLPDGREVARPGWSPGAEAVAEREAQMRGRFYLVKIGGNAGLGEVWRCRRCHGRHPYLTFGCQERPFNGLDQAAYAIYQQTGDLATVRSLDPRQQARQADKRAFTGLSPSIPDLSTLHPEMARQIAQASGLTPLDVMVGGLKLGRIEPIPRSLAQRLLDKCNANLPEAGRLRVEGLTF